MKFLYVAPRFHPNQYPIIEGLMQKGHQVMFCVSRVGTTEKHDGVTVKVMSPSLLSRMIRTIAKRKGENYAEDKMIFWFSPKYAETKRCVKEFAPDAVVLRDRNMLSLRFAQVCRSCGVKKVLLYNQGPVYRRPQKGIKNLIKKAFISLFPQKRITVCRYKEYPFTKDGLAQDKYAYFLPFVARQQLEEDRRYLKDGIVNIFDCGKYRPYKNHGVLIDALAILRNKGYFNFKATILGQADNEEEKAYLQEMKDKIRQYGLEAFVVLKTSVPYDEIPGYYLENDVFVLASAREQAAVSVLDALAYGLATICTSANGTADYVKAGETGYIFKTRDAQQLSEKIENYLKEPELVIKHGRAAICDVKDNFGFESYYNQFIAIVEGL